MINYIKLKMQAIADLLTKKKELDQQIEETSREWKKARIAEVKHLMDQHGITIKEITPAKAKRKKPAIKYTDGKNTWTGRGKEPLWIKGRDRDQFKAN